MQTQESSTDRKPALTPRQMEICRMIVEGKLNKEIALAEHKHKMSVAHQIQYIMQKTGATNRAMIAAWYVRQTEVRR